MSDIPFSEKPYHISTKTENREYVQCHFTEPHRTHNTVTNFTFSVELLKAM